MTGRFTKQSIGITVITATLVVLAAYLARLWAELGLESGETIPLLGNLIRLALGETTGVAFGLLKGSRLVPWLTVLALFAFVLFLARPLLGSRPGAVSLGLILGGGVANLLDRHGDERVTDYVDVGLGSWRWPTFNLPDVAITVGTLLVMWLLAGSGRSVKDTWHESDGEEKAV